PPPAMGMVAPGKAIVRWMQPDIRGDATNTWEELQSAVAARSEAFEVLEQIIERPALDFQLDYRQGFNLLLPQLAELKRSAQVLSAGSLSDLHRGDAEAAALKLRAILALVKGMESEPVVISQLVRAAIANIAMAATWEFLQCTNLPESSLAA